MLLRILRSLVLLFVPVFRLAVFPWRLSGRLRRRLRRLHLLTRCGRRANARIDALLLDRARLGTLYRPILHDLRLRLRSLHRSRRVGLPLVRALSDGVVLLRRQFTRSTNETAVARHIGLRGVRTRLRLVLRILCAWRSRIPARRRLTHRVVERSIRILFVDAFDTCGLFLRGALRIRIACRCIGLTLMRETRRWQLARPRGRRLLRGRAQCRCVRLIESRILPAIRRCARYAACVGLALRSIHRAATRRGQHDASRCLLLASA